MGTMAAITGAVGGLCAVMGIIIALEVDLPLSDQLTWMFWFVLAAILLLASIALAVGSGGGRE